MLFPNREVAGRRLAKELEKFDLRNALVIALPRGGVPIGYQIAKRHALMLSVIGVRKIASVGNKEYGVGAIAEGDVQILDLETVDFLHISPRELKKVIEEEKEELLRRVSLYRQGEDLPDMTDKTVILTDDGLATGVTARAAVTSLRKRDPKEILFATPVCAFETAVILEDIVDEVVCLSSPAPFVAVGKWYQDFDQVTDNQVISYLQNAQSFVMS